MRMGRPVPSGAWPRPLRREQSEQGGGGTDQKPSRLPQNPQTCMTTPISASVSNPMPDPIRPQTQIQPLSSTSPRHQSRALAPPPPPCFLAPVTCDPDPDLGHYPPWARKVRSHAHGAQRSAQTLPNTEGSEASPCLQQPARSRKDDPGLSWTAPPPSKTHPAPHPRCLPLQLLGGGRRCFPGLMQTPTATRYTDTPEGWHEENVACSIPRAEPGGSPSGGSA